MLHVFHHSLKKELATQPVHSYQGDLPTSCVFNRMVLPVSRTPWFENTSLPLMLIWVCLGRWIQCSVWPRRWLWTESFQTIKQTTTNPVDCWLPGLAENKGLTNGLKASARTNNFETTSLYKPIKETSTLSPLNQALYLLPYTRTPGLSSAVTSSGKPATQLASARVRNSRGTPI